MTTKILYEVQRTWNAALIGSFLDESDAERLAERLAHEGIDTRIVTSEISTDAVVERCDPDCVDIVSFVVAEGPATHDGPHVYRVGFVVGADAPEDVDRAERARRGEIVTYERTVAGEQVVHIESCAADEEDAVVAWHQERENLSPQISSRPHFVPPPDGWFTFGSHVGAPCRLEWSQETDEAGMPLWERPAGCRSGRDEKTTPDTGLLIAIDRRPFTGAFGWTVTDLDLGHVVAGGASRTEALAAQRAADAVGAIGAERSGAASFFAQMEPDPKEEL